MIINLNKIKINKKVTSNKTKHVLVVENELNELSEKVKLLSAKDYSFFLGRIYFTSNNVSQNMFVYQPTFNVLELKNDRGTEYIISWKSNGIHNSKLIALYGAFLPNVKYIF